ncbi:MAG: pyrroline-5-carboxylate reductase [Fuerstiella sp.]
MKLDDVRIGFVGTGRMASALAAGFTRSLIPARQISGVDPVAASRDQFSKAIGQDAIVSASASDALKSANVVFLAVKPQVMQAVLTDLRPVLSPDQLIVSIAAGLTVPRLESWLPAETRLIRVMPNTPCLIGKGACGVSRGSCATEQDELLVCELLSSVGVVERVPEKLLDAVTGLSGSGPAYVFQMIEALSDGGVKVGLPRDVATRLAAQTLLGAAEMVLQTGEHPAALKDAVTSPGGTTIAALHEMELGGVRAALMNAVETATNRSKELG